jgi:hypothetical protein
MGCWARQNTQIRGHGHKPNYAAFSQNPPGKTGTTHIFQLNMFLEPMFGGDWAGVEALSNSILSGKAMEDKIQVQGGPESVISPGPHAFFWVSDGAPVNGIRL